MDVVIPGHLSLTPDLSQARVVVRRNQGVFAAGTIPREVRDVLEWFVDPSCVLLVPPPGQPAGCECAGDSIAFWGVVVEPNVPKKVGELHYELDLTAGSERVHLVLYLKEEDPPLPPMSMTSHLRRMYEAMMRAGIPTLELEAGLESGPTFWAYAGVGFARGRPLLDHLELLAVELTGAAAPPVFNTPEDVRMFAGSEATVREAYDRSLQLTGGPVWVADGQLNFMVNELGMSVDDPLPVGKAILFAISPWEGRVEVGVSDTRFLTFLGLP